jgi:HlyD family secretion protein
MTSLFRSHRVRAGLTALGIIALVAAVAWFGLSGRSGPAARKFDLVTPRRDTITATVNATGQIEAQQIANLSFVTPGRVAAVLVRVGDRVRAGAPLARLDTRELEIRLAQAEAQLQQAQASYEKLAAGATPADLAIAAAQLRQAQAQQQQTAGSVSPADLAAARAQLEQARLALRAAEAGADPTELQLAEAQLQQAQAQLDAQRSQLSAAKTNAELALQQAANALTQAQARYATAKANWEYVQATGADPIVRTVADPSRPGKTRPNTLNESQQRQYYDAFVQAEAALRSAEAQLQQAQVSADNARQAEAAGVRLVEQQLAAAQTKRDQVAAGASADQRAAARAQVAAAEANLNRLLGGQRSGALAAAEAAVAQAQARLEQLKAGPQPSDLALGQAQVASARAARDLAKLALDEATLIAPFDGTVAEVNMRIGELASAARPAVVLADLSGFSLTVRVDEIDIPRLNAGQPVTITLDALPGLALPGQVTQIAPLSASQASSASASTVTSYQVQISAQASDARVRPGMSASVDIIVARKDGALLVPRRAVRNDRGRLVVDVPVDPAVCAAPLDPRAAQPALTQVPVTTGLSNELLIEVTSGLNEQSCVYVEGIDARLRDFLAGGPPRRN